MSKRYIFDSNMWLAHSQAISRAALADAASSDSFENASHIIQIGQVDDREVGWALNQNPQILGSGFFANSHISYSKFSSAKSVSTAFPNTAYFEFLGQNGFRSLGSNLLPGFGRLLVVYFPGEISISNIEPSNGMYHLNSSKVIEIKCVRNIVTTDVINFVIGFVSSTGAQDIRYVDESFNVSPDRHVFKAQFVVPPNSVYAFLGKSDSQRCEEPIVNGYTPKIRSIEKYSKLISKDPFFKDLHSWVGHPQISPSGGVAVGPGPDAHNIIFQRIQVTPSQNYLIKASAYTRTTVAQGRLQINWHAGDDVYIATSSTIFKVGNEREDFQLMVQAPFNAAYGELYVSPHSKSDELAFTMMSMLESE